MKKIRILSLIILMIAVFVSLDLLGNFLGSLVPDINDGISTHSIIPGHIYFGDGSWSRERFFHAFLFSAWITFLLFVWNIAITVVVNDKKK